MCKTSEQSIVLIGFMGAGKTTLGRCLADLSGMPVVDLDTLIVQQRGRDIPGIFAEEGEEAFRNYETSALGSLLGYPPVILATGGGIVGRPENWQLMRRLGTVVYLRARWETLRQRLAGSSGRPLATADRDEADIKALWQRRLPLYEQADLVIDTDARRVDEVARAVLEGVENRWQAC